MNYLLPEKKEILPITESWSTFYESGFNDNFDNMPFKIKLQIIADIIRQTILFDEYPNPIDEEINLVGDSYTASKVLINYLKELNLGENYRCVLAQEYLFDPNQLYSTHFIILLDHDGKTYQIDCTPTTGYKCGKVEEQNIKKFYNSYIELNNENLEYLNIIRTILYKANHEILNEKDIKKYINIINQLPKNDILNGYIFKSMNSLYVLAQDKELKDKILNNCATILSNMKKQKRYVKDGIVFANIDVYKEIKSLKEELDTLINEDNNYKRQLEIAQAIVAELIKYNKQFDKKLDINNKKISFTNINPRLLLESGLNVVLLKPSSFKSGVSSIIKEKYLEKDNHIFGEYYPNLGSPSETFGLKPMRLFHPCGYQYERSMYGPGDLFLVKGKADNIKATKKELRNSLANDYKNTKIIWYDGKEITWDPAILNLVHTTDDPSEASLHYLAAYPEYQLMTRFMYPNPKLKVLEKENNYERV